MSVDPADCSINEVVEYCERCGRDTVHGVRISVAEMGSNGDNAKFSREPQRLSQCVDCGDTKTEWLTRT